MAQARPHGPAPTMRRSSDTGFFTADLSSDDLISPRSHAHVRDRRLHQLPQPIEIPTSLLRQIFDPPGILRRSLPAVEPLVARHYLLERCRFRREFGVLVAADFVAGAYRELVER